MNCVLMMAGVALIGSAIARAAEPEPSSPDSKELRALNQEYIRSVGASDVEWFQRNLAADFVCTNPDGSLVDREQFLKQTALPVNVSNIEAHDVIVRVMGDFAIIHARTTYSLANGQTGSRRYTDVWARRQGRWLAVSAHITPVR
jgi:ketosteroid isomerase-like protein